MPRPSLVLMGLLIIGAFTVAWPLAIRPSIIKSPPPDTPAEQTAPAAATPSSNDGYLLPAYDPAPAWAEAQPSEEDFNAGTVFSLVFKLVLVLALIYGTAWVLKRFRFGIQPAPPKGQQINVVETARMAPNQTLHLIEVQGQTFLIGATEQRISLISSLSKETPAAIPVSASLGYVPDLVPEPVRRVEETGEPPTTNLPDGAFREPEPVVAGGDGAASFEQLLSQTEVRVGRLREQIAQRYREGAALGLNIPRPPRRGRTRTETPTRDM
ncbi:MAG: flagellar biosynthetic protein FliO [Chloroflexi bacterium]|nr:flagellar biosynthetic protein FliO [Chloroflexota bacterium]